MEKCFIYKILFLSPIFHRKYNIIGPHNQTIVSRQMHACQSRTLETAPLILGFPLAYCVLVATEPQSLLLLAVFSASI